MSSTNRGGKRNESDFYATPPWVVHRLLDEMESLEGPNYLPGGRWLESCAGDGEIIRAVNSRRNDVCWSACELRKEMRPMLEPLVPGELLMGDFLQTNLEAFGGKKFDVAITNPPFSIAMPVVRKCRELAHTTVLLLRLNFWGSDERQAFMREFPPHTYVLPNRPMFSLNKNGKPGTDSPEYAWFIWPPESGTHGEIRVLARTPKEERKKWGDHLRSLAPPPPEPVLNIDAEPAFTLLGPDRNI